MQKNMKLDTSAVDTNFENHDIVYLLGIWYGFYLPPPSVNV